MKKSILAVFSVISLAILLSCGSPPPAREAGIPEAQPAAPVLQPPPPAAPTVSPAPVVQSVPVTRPAPVPQPVSPYFTGAGGRGTRLAVLVPDARGLPEDQDYLPAMVQGVLVDHFNTFSAISVLDRLSLESVLAETESGIYQTPEDFGRLGEIVNVDYVLTGSITRTATGHALQVQVIGTGGDNIGVTRATFSGTPTVAEMDDHTGIRMASMQLLTQMGVALTDMARTELSRAETRQAINAQAALAQGITAQRGGTVVEALSRYIQAANFDPTLAEAASRMNILAANISSGNIGMDVRNEIAWRNQWVERLREAEAFYANHLRTLPPYFLVYSTEIERGAINFERETISLSIRISSLPAEPAWFDMINQVIRTVRDGLRATGRAETWGLGIPDRVRFQYWPAQSVTTPSPFILCSRRDFDVDVEIINAEGRSIGRQTVNLPFGWVVPIGSVGSGAVHDAAFIAPHLTHNTRITFPAVDANAITDNLIIRINSINGIAAERAAAQLRISILPVHEYNRIQSVIDNGLDTDNLNRFWLSFSDSTYRGPYGSSARIRGTHISRLPEGTSLIIPYGVTSIGSIIPYRDLFFTPSAGNQLTSLVIPNSVITIGGRAFSGSRLTSVNIPDSVISIGHDAFSRSQLTSVTVGNNVTRISAGAFSNSQLTSVTINIPNTRAVINSGAFSGNPLTSITFGDDVHTVWGDNLFGNSLRNVRQISIGSNVTLYRNRDGGNTVWNSFIAAYRQNNRMAGVYTLRGNTWTFEAR